MIRKIIRYAKKNWFMIWGIVVSLTFTSIVGMAAYTKRHSVKRVVSTQAGGFLLSSNYLSRVSNDKSSPMRTLYATDAEIYVNRDMNICNYLQGDKTRFNSDNLTYTMKVTLTNKNGTPISEDKCYVEEDGEGNLTRVPVVKIADEVITSDGKEFSGVLSKKVESTNWYKIEVHRSQLKAKNADKIYIKIVAEVTVENSAEKKYLASTIKVAEKSEEGQNWKSYLNETSDDPSELYGFNYVISGAGAGELSFEWDSNYIDINKNFEARDGVTVTDLSDGYRRLTMNVGHEEADGTVINRYDIQFYRTSPASETEEWSRIEGTGEIINVVNGNTEYFSEIEFTHNT